MNRARVVAAGLVAFSLSIPALGQNSPLREGTGQRLADLDKLELTPFPASNWALLSDWANGDALSPATTD